MDKDANTFCYREYYQPDRLISYHRESIAALSEHESYQFNLADPSIFAKMMQKHGGRWCVADEYADVVNLPRGNALFWSPADNNELGTRNRINEYLHVDPNRIHPVTKERGAPRLYFVKRTDAYPNGCSNILKETRSQKRVAVGTDGGVPVFTDERDDTIRDHGYDVLRYFIASRAPLAQDRAQKPDARSWLAAQQRLTRDYRDNLAVQ